MERKFLSIFRENLVTVNENFIKEISIGGEVMANYNNPNYLQQPQLMNGMTGQPQVQFPYGSNNMLLSNTPYNNYMGNRPIDSQDLLSNQFLKCRPVSSKDEARAFQIDLDGSLWVFTDLGNGKIYTKQVNNDGTAAFKTYVFTED